MQRVTERMLIAAAVLLVLSPRAVRADGFVAPWFGSTFSQGPDFRSATSGRPTFGAALGTSGGGLFGFDIDFGYTPSFFGDESKAGKNNVVTIMGNLIAGPSIETSGGKGVKPYGTFGIGLIHSKVAVNADNNFGWDGGGGVMGFLSGSIGIRGDLRYFHTVNNSSATNTVLLKPGKFHFWRAYVGVIFR